jgi:hypothetical protein
MSVEIYQRHLLVHVAVFASLERGGNDGLGPD